LTKILSVTGLAILLAACDKQPKEETSATPKAEPILAAAVAPSSAPKEVSERVLRRFAPVRARIEGEKSPALEDRVALGRMLFYETRLSKSQSISCNSCHRLDNYGVDNETTSPGHDGARGKRNSPTVYHAAGFADQFWDGRAEDVEQQALGPILAGVEMAAPSPEYVVKVLKSMPEYVKAFQRAFPDEKESLKFANVGVAVGAFERGLVTPSRWDDFLRGNKQALSAEETDGLNAFAEVGCADCHTGEFLGGSMLKKAGVVQPWPNQADVGREGVTKNEIDRMMFKVPTLRNISKTGPYFHDGSVKTLEDAVTMMGKHQLGIEMSKEEVAAIVTWMGALTGEIPTDYINKPSLPESTSETPRADITATASVHETARH
jgi:cytochrome c peroxidase